MHYLRITATYTAKNAAEKEALEVLASFQNTLIKDSVSLIAVGTAINECLDRVNQNHPRCKNIESKRVWQEELEIYCSVSSPKHTFLYYSIYKIQRTF